MKPFESFMAPRLDEFLVYRKGLGYKMRGLTSQLTAFDRYLKKNESKEKLLAPSFFLEMRANLNAYSGAKLPPIPFYCYH